MANIETLKVDTFNFAEGAAPSTPASGQVVVYAKTDGKLYAKDDAGTEYLLGSFTAGGATLAAASSVVYAHATFR